MEVPRPRHTFDLMRTLLPPHANAVLVERNQHSSRPSADAVGATAPFLWLHGCGSVH